MLILYQMRLLKTTCFPLSLSSDTAEKKVVDVAARLQSIADNNIYEMK